MTVTGREHALGVLRSKLGPTRVGRRWGLPDTATLDDYRETVPIFDRATHEREVETLLGFGVMDDAEPDAMSLVFADREREQVHAAWDERVGPRPRRIALLQAHGDDPLAERALRDDLRGWCEELFVLDRIDDAARVVDRLAAFDPEVLVTPSAMLCAWLERSCRAPLSRRLPALRAVLCEHDVGRRARLGVPLLTVGWFVRGLRCGVPSPRPPIDGVTLAVGSQLVELLPYTNPEDDGRRVYAERTILPEAAMLGHRYEVVLSSPLGMLRLRTEQHVRVVGFDPPTALAPMPRVRVVRLSTPPADAALEGCTVAGAWLTASVRQALTREDPALVNAEIGPDPQSVGDGSAAASSSRLGDGFGDTEIGEVSIRGGAPRRPSRPRALSCRIELQGLVRADLPRKISARIDDNLRRRSPAYAYLRGKGELDPPRVIVVQPGTAAAQRLRRITQLRGAVWMPDVRVVV
jgi:hypothetical protein